MSNFLADGDCGARPTGNRSTLKNSRCRKIADVCYRTLQKNATLRGKGTFRKNTTLEGINTLRQSTKQRGREGPVLEFFPQNRSMDRVWTPCDPIFFRSNPNKFQARQNCKRVFRVCRITPFHKNAMHGRNRLSAVSTAEIIMISHDDVVPSNRCPAGFFATAVGSMHCRYPSATLTARYESPGRGEVRSRPGAPEPTFEQNRTGYEGVFRFGYGSGSE